MKSIKLFLLMLVGMIASVTLVSCENDKEELITSFRNSPEYKHWFDKPGSFTNYVPVDNYLEVLWKPDAQWLYGQSDWSDYDDSDELYFLAKERDDSGKPMSLEAYRVQSNDNCKSYNYVSLAYGFMTFGEKEGASDNSKFCFIEHDTIVVMRSYDRFYRYIKK